MEFNFPNQFLFADSHEYAFPEGDLAKIGISAFAVDQLGDIVFVDLPDVGSTLKRGESFGSIESVKAVEEMYSPLTGEVVKVNESVLSEPERIQNDPHGEGWLLQIRIEDSSELNQLLESASYASKVSAN
ncbi:MULTISPECIES: glycine cleavage system protein GcvH [Prochlorococcus]|uniref:glycine cleavage system protein GcvH n=1 Tax=Prochlorococcus TaxID=1218 RepID=UPI000533BD0F|nr:MULTISPECIES: glycine cleavage system protein GcvH [Prochlorococcus]KGG13699.1 Glycine cleavage system H protein [Prochlorococcus sp. MIT 0601]